MFGWSTSFLFMKFYTAVPITGIITKASISILTNEKTVFLCISSNQVIRSFLYTILKMLFNFAFNYNSL